MDLSSSLLRFVPSYWCSTFFSPSSVLIRSFSLIPRSFLRSELCFVPFRCLFYISLFVLCTDSFVLLIILHSFLPSGLCFVPSHWLSSSPSFSLTNPRSFFRSGSCIVLISVVLCLSLVSFVTSIRSLESIASDLASLPFRCLPFFVLFFLCDPSPDTTFWRPSCLVISHYYIPSFVFQVRQRLVSSRLVCRAVRPVTTKREGLITKTGTFTRSFPIPSKSFKLRVTGIPTGERTGRQTDAARKKWVNAEGNRHGNGGKREENRHWLIERKMYIRTQ